MSQLFLRESERACYIVTVWDGKKDYNEIHPQDYEKLKNTIEEITNRPKLDDFPKNQIQVKDRLDLMSKAVSQPVFFNGLWITKNESMKIKEMVLDAMNRFSNGEILPCLPRIRRHVPHERPRTYSPSGSPWAA